MAPAKPKKSLNKLLEKKRKCSRGSLNKSLEEKRRANHGLPAEVTLMDGQMWKDFPEELMEPVIARLPLATFFRFTTVCQKWYSLRDSSSFLQLSEQIVQQNCPWLFATYDGTSKKFKINPGRKMKAALYDPREKKWHYDMPFPAFMALPPACAAGGLICYTDYTCRSFCVGNPVTQIWRHFPWSATARFTMQENSFQAVGMANPKQQGCKIMWVDTQGQFEVYDLSTGSIRLGRVPANIKLPTFLPRCSSVSVGTVVYFWCLKPDGIISYDVVSGMWEQFLVPTPPISAYRALAECGGRLLLVGLVKDNNPASAYLCVWELQTKVKVWTQVDKIPNSLCSEFICETTGRRRCYGNNRTLVFSVSKGATLTKINRVFTYDLVTRKWSNVPAFAPPGQRCGWWLFSGIGFFPSLSASPW